MPSPNHITALILAGGFGTRVKDLLNDLPKPMAPVNGKPFIEWIVRWLKAQSIRDVIISTGYRAEVLVEYFKALPVPEMNVQCVTEPEPIRDSHVIIRGLLNGTMTVISDPLWS